MIAPLFAALLAAGTSGHEPAVARCGTAPERRRDALAVHAYAAGARASLADADPDADAGDVAVLHDRGDLVVARNPFDLAGRGVRLSPNRDGGYDALPAPLPVDAPGTALPAAQGPVAVALPFAFPFFGRSFDRAFVHGDGSLTFDAPDAAPGEHGLARLLSGPPRIAPFLADLDPARAGSVTARLLPDRAVFQWNGVPGSAQINSNTFGVTLLPSGAIEMAWAEMQTTAGVAGVSPGGALEPTVADLSAGEPRGSRGALVERFSESAVADLVSTARRFYAGHGDDFDQLVVYTARPLNPVPGTLAFELNLRNAVEGLGLALRDDGAAWGSAARLSSLVFMDDVDTYAEVDGFEVLGHEVAHRWLASLRFRDASGQSSDALLTPDHVHWSFFVDTGASVMGGNTMTSHDGLFTTVDFARGYGPLDQYAMGLRTPGEVPPVDYVAEPDDFRPNRTYRASSSPEAGVSFTGIPRQVAIADVIAAMGPRVPEGAAAPRAWRIAFLLVADREAPATAERVATVARIAERFRASFRDATDGRGAAETRLR